MGSRCTLDINTRNNCRGMSENNNAQKRINTERSTYREADHKAIRPLPKLQPRLRWFCPLTNGAHTVWNWSPPPRDKYLRRNNIFCQVRFYKSRDKLAPRRIVNCTHPGIHSHWTRDSSLAKCVGDLYLLLKGIRRSTWSTPTNSTLLLGSARNYIQRSRRQLNSLMRRSTTGTVSHIISTIPRTLYTLL